MQNAEYKTWWDEHFPESPPLGHLLRRFYLERWLRIHSLPKSKRYAENEEEYAELDLRHNTVATDILGHGCRCLLIRGTYSNITDQGWIINLDEGEFEQRLQFDVTETTWEQGKFYRLLRDVADWKLTNVVFVSQETGSIYAPYDGGADLIFLSEEVRDKRKKTYKDWLSRHPEGL